MSKSRVGVRAVNWIDGGLLAATGDAVAQIDSLDGSRVVTSLNLEGCGVMYAMVLAELLPHLAQELKLHLNEVTH